MQLDDLVKRVRVLTSQFYEMSAKVAKIDKQIYGLFLAGVLFWGAAQLIVVRELSKIDESIKSVQEHEAAIQLLQFRQNQQDNLNRTTVSTLESMRTTEQIKHQELQRRMDQLSRQVPLIITDEN